MTLPDWASTWLELGLQDWDAIFGIILGIAGVGALVRAFFRWNRRRIDALPVAAEFGFTGDSLVDADGVRWEMAWLQNTGSRAYVHDVYWVESAFGVVWPEKSPQVAKIDEIHSLPRKLRSLSKRELLHEEGVFKPQYLSAGKKVRFYVFCPPEVAELTLGATMSIGRRGDQRSVCSKSFDVLHADGLELGTIFPW